MGGGHSVVVHAFNPSYRWISKEFQDSQGCTVKSYFEKLKKKKKN